MTFDLFSFLDCDFGVGFGGIIFFMSLSSIWISVFFLGFLVYWYCPTEVEGHFICVVEKMIKSIPGDMKVVAGAPHVFFALLIVMLSLNVSGSMPFSHPANIHFFSTMSLGVPFCFGAVAVNYNSSWPMFWTMGVRGDSFVIPAMMAFLSEWVSFLARPATLCCRLAMNIMVGQVFLKMVSSFCVLLLYPFGYQFFIYGLLSTIACAGMLSSEIFVGAVQALVFTGLLAYYVYETSYSPK